MKTATIIFPLHKDNLPMVDYRYPETEKTPQEQVDFIKSLAQDPDIAKQNEISVITTSFYIIEGIMKLFKLTDENIIFSDGRDNVDANVIWTLMAKPMKELLFID